MDYIFSILNTLPPETFTKGAVFICVGGVKTGGQFVLRGPEDAVKELSGDVLELIGGKGGGKKGQLQGKATNFQKLHKVHKLIQKYVQAGSVER